MFNSSYLICSVLFQMALIPFTMSRYTIATFSSSKLNKYLPLDKALRIHIHLGYTMVSIVFSATIVFFIFFGLSCSEGEEAFCDKFTSEIMITGYCILGILVSLRKLVFSFSFVSHHNKPTLSSIASFYPAAHGRDGVLSSLYSIWIVLWSSLPLPRYVCHCSWWVRMMIQLFFTFVQHLTYFTTAHTFDIAQRSGKKDRSQTFKWFAAPLIYYLCDYATMWFNQRWECTVFYLQLLQVQLPIKCSSSPIPSHFCT